MVKILDVQHDVTTEPPNLTE